jgi:anthraniloyl-CoA monooxygenase
MRIVIVGGGPGGLYAGLLLKNADERHDVIVIDRNPPDATYGWGVVFSDETLGFLEEADRESYEKIANSFVRWESIDIHYRDELVRSGGHAFSGLSRRRLLAILQGRCRDVGVQLRHHTEVQNLEAFGDADLVIAADGVNSRIRTERREIFRPTFDVHHTKYIWLGIHLPLAAFTFVFRETEYGMFQVHAYPFDAQTSTCIVECNEDVWKRAGLDRAGEAESLRFCQQVFADFLAGRPLLSNRSSWISFVTLRNENWRDGHIVLLGDAAHTAHFSVGSGTKIAMEDAIALQRAVERHADVRAALLEYEELRQPIVERTQLAARESSLWFEHVPRYASFAPPQFAFSLLTRSKRVSYENLRLRDSEFSDRVAAWFARRPAEPKTAPSFPPPPPHANPFAMRQVRVPNRIAVEARTGDTAEGGLPNETHLVMAASQAIAGAGLILPDTAAVCAEGRITTGCPGVYDLDQEQAWEGIVRFIHRRSTSSIGLRLGHCGPRGSTRRRADGADLPLSDGNWPLVAASAGRYAPGGQTARAMERMDMVSVCDRYAAAAERAARAGFDLLELDIAHGCLLASFLSPLTNRREDDWGGCLTNRLRFPLEVFAAVRAVWPESRPISVRLGAADWIAGGTTLEEAIEVAQTLDDRGCDLIHLATGQTVYRANPPYGRAWETAYADAIRNEAHIPVLVGGYLTTLDEIDTILAAGRADLCVLERGGT